jgi:nicotinate-nucleotide adenylyltransferase
MVFLATEDYPNLKPSDVEFRLPQPNYTVNTLAHLQEKFPTHEFSLIMGEDNLNSLHKWKNYEVLLQNHDIYVYPRIDMQSIDPEIEASARIHRVDAPVIEISSTFIRDSIKQGKNIKALLPTKVWDYIDHNIFYKK